MSNFYKDEKYENGICAKGGDHPLIVDNINKIVTLNTMHCTDRYNKCTKTDDMCITKDNYILENIVKYIHEEYIVLLQECSSYLRKIIEDFIKTNPIFECILTARPVSYLNIETDPIINSKYIFSDTNIDCKKRDYTVFIITIFSKNKYKHLNTTPIIDDFKNINFDAATQECVLLDDVQYPTGGLHEYYRHHMVELSNLNNTITYLIFNVHYRQDKRFNENDDIGTLNDFVALELLKYINTKKKLPIIIIGGDFNKFAINEWSLSHHIYQTTHNNLESLISYIRFYKLLHKYYIYSNKNDSFIILNNNYDRIYYFKPKNIPRLKDINIINQDLEVYLYNLIEKINNIFIILKQDLSQNIDKIKKEIKNIIKELINNLLKPILCLNNAIYNYIEYILYILCLLNENIHNILKITILYCHDYIIYILNNIFDILTKNNIKCFTKINYNNIDDSKNMELFEYLNYLLKIKNKKIDNKSKNDIFYLFYNNNYNNFKILKMLEYYKKEDDDSIDDESEDKKEDESIDDESEDKKEDESIDDESEDKTKQKKCHKCKKSKRKILTPAAKQKLVSPKKSSKYNFFLKYQEILTNINEKLIIYNNEKINTTYDIIINKYNTIIDILDHNILEFININELTTDFIKNILRDASESDTDLKQNINIMLQKYTLNIKNVDRFKLQDYNIDNIALVKKMESLYDYNDIKFEKKIIFELGDNVLLNKILIKINDILINNIFNYDLYICYLSAIYYQNIYKEDDEILTTDNIKLIASIFFNIINLIDIYKLIMSINLINNIYNLEHISKGTNLLNTLEIICINMKKLIEIDFNLPIKNLLKNIYDLIYNIFEYIKYHNLKEYDSTLFIYINNIINNIINLHLYLYIPEEKYHIMKELYIHNISIDYFLKYENNSQYHKTNIYKLYSKIYCKIYNFNIAELIDNNYNKIKDLLNLNINYDNISDDINGIYNKNMRSIIFSMYKPKLISIYENYIGINKLLYMSYYSIKNNLTIIPDKYITELFIDYNDQLGGTRYSQINSKIDMNSLYVNKYLKYKFKYLSLKNNNYIH